MVSLADFKIGDEIRFVKEYDCHDSYENPLYLPPLPANTRGRVISIESDHLVISVVNPLTMAEVVSGYE